MATNVVIGGNIKKTSDRINPNGDIINARTKQVIEPNVPVYTPTPEEIARTVTKQEAITTLEAPQRPTPQASANNESLNILEQIKQAEDNLKALKELKKLKIAEKKAELELLEQ